MALIPEAIAAPTGTATAGRTAVNGDTIGNLSDKTQLVVQNASGGSVTVTITAVKPCSQGVLHDSVSVVAAGTTKVIGPIDSRYANSVSGLAVVNYSATASVTVYTTRV